MASLIIPFIYVAMLANLIRNIWVYIERSKLIDRFNSIPISEWLERTRRGEKYDSDYLTYGQMMWRFWVWDIEKLRKPGR